MAGQPGDVPYWAEQVAVDARIEQQCANLFRRLIGLPIRMTGAEAAAEIIRIYRLSGGDRQAFYVLLAANRRRQLDRTTSR
jgi:hypothetical protein